VSHDGDGLRVIGNGMFPEWSPDRKSISYVEAAPIFGRESSTTDMGHLIVANPEGSKISRAREVWKTGNIIRYYWNPKGNNIPFFSSLLADDTMVPFRSMTSKQNVSKPYTNSYGRIWMIPLLQRHCSGRQMGNNCFFLLAICSQRGGILF
jgi:hypothetical protein